MPGKRCVCGRSQRFPICDGSHTDEQWSCEPEVAVELPWIVLSSPRNANLALRLAAALGGRANPEQPAAADRLVVLTDGPDAGLLARRAERFQARERRLFGVGVPREVLAPAFREWFVDSVETDDARVAWRQVLERINDPAQPEPGPLPSVFLSHAVRDEPALMPAVEALRMHWGAQVFTCGDSIPAGSRWHPRIMEALSETERVVFVLSAASARSTFCAFEIGYALSRDLPIRLISLDGTLPPPWVQHLQAADLPRDQRLRPWLDEHDLLLDALLRAMS